jgi:hypothetical protein
MNKSALAIRQRLDTELSYHTKMKWTTEERAIRQPECPSYHGELINRAQRINTLRQQIKKHI